MKKKLINKKVSKFRKNSLSTIQVMIINELIFVLKLVSNEETI
jgi:hypothetical protein